MHLKKSLISLFLTGITAFSLLTACGSNQKTNDSHLIFGCDNYANSIDPAQSISASWNGVRFGTLQCLFAFDQNMVAQPLLCDDYSVSNDYTTWTFHLRDDVQFSNGNSMTASAVLTSFQRLYQETDASQGGTGLSTPETYLPIPTMTADDETGTITLVCQTPTANLPGILAYPYFAVVDTSEDDIVGTGPYAFVQMDALGTTADLVQNQYYWDGEVPFETVTMRFIADSTTKALALENGEIHVAENINAPTEVEKFKADDTIHVSETAGMRTGYAYINFQGVLANDDLRAAVLMALDNDTMCNTIVGGMYQPGFSILSSALAYGYDQLENPYAYDVDGAVARLDQAGIVDSNGDGIRELDGAPIILTYLVYANRSLPDLVEAISIQLAQIGIQVDVQLWDYDTLINLQTAGEFDLSASNMNTVAVGDPQEFLGNWYSSNSSSYGFYSNPEYDALYAQLTETLDNDQRTALIVQLQQILIDDGAALVHGYYTSRMFSRTEDVVGAEISVADYYWITTNMKQP